MSAAATAAAVKDDVKLHRGGSKSLQTMFGLLSLGTVVHGLLLKKQYHAAVDVVRTMR